MPPKFGSEGGPKKKPAQEAKGTKEVKSTKKETKGNSGETINTDELAKNISGMPTGGLDKKIAFQLAGLTDAEGNSVQGTKGGRANIALREVEKFKNLTAQELAIKLIQGEHSFPVFNLEDDMSKAESVRVRETQALQDLKGNGFGEETEEYKEQKLIVDNATELFLKTKKVLDSLDKRALLEAAINTPNLLVPQRLDFFKKGEKKIDINSEDLVSKLLAANYSSGYLRHFVETADNGSLFLSLSKKLAKKDPTILGDLEKAYPDKFK